jgi:O-succinylhomoserine sulfhydrylase
MKDKKTQAIRLQVRQSHNREHSTPLYLTSSFTFNNAEQGRALFADEIQGNIYSRFTNPNVSELIDKMVLLENTEDGFAFASGMAAVFAAFGALLQAGDHVIASRSLFGSTHQILTKILPKWQISHTLVEPDKPQTWEAAIQENTRMFFIETPSNPGLDIVDLESAGKLKKKFQLILNVDNTFSTPLLQNPADFGADLVTHSATKFLDGQGRVMGGLVLGKKDLLNEIRFFARQTGPSLSPFNAWMLSKSLETLAVRMDRHCENAALLAKTLNHHKELEIVRYPFLPSHPQFDLAKKQMRQGGSIVTFIVRGGYQRAVKFMNALQNTSLTANLGDTRTIVTHPSSTTHSKLTDTERERAGIYPGLIRISVGIEHIDDITDDILQALEKSVS